MHEWSLLIFTYCLQIAIGAVTIYSLLKVSLFKGNAFVNEKIFFSTLSALSIVGLIGSFTHLGTPTNAINAIRNFATSWMSREIIFASAFIGGIVLITVLFYINKTKFQNVLMLATSLVGLVLVFTMGKIYDSSLVSGWSGVSTFAAFYATTIILGSCLVLAFAYKKLSTESSLLKNILLVLVFVGISLNVLGLFFLPTTLAESTIIATSPALTTFEAYSGFNIARYILLLVGAVLLFVFTSTKLKKMNPAFIYAAMVLVAVGEFLGRYVFFTFAS